MIAGYDQPTDDFGNPQGGGGGGRTQQPQSGDRFGGGQGDNQGYGGGGLGDQCTFLFS